MGVFEDWRSRRSQTRAGSASPPTAGRPRVAARIGMRPLGVKAMSLTMSPRSSAVRCRPASRSAPSAWRTGRRCGRPSRPARSRRKSRPPPSAGRRGRSRGCCRPNASLKLSAQSPPWSKEKPRQPPRANAASACAPRRRRPAAESRRAMRSTLGDADGSGVRDLGDRAVYSAFGRPAVGGHLD